MQDWNLANIWNGSFEPTERQNEPRERLWASELWKPDIDLYWLLRGRQSSNVPNSRSKRKFDAGELHEWFVRLVLQRAGIYRSSQDRVVMEQEGLLPVSGKLDFVAGGIPTLDESLDELFNNINIPELYKRQGFNLVEKLCAMYPDGLIEKNLEIKSVASFGFDRIERSGKPLSGHDIQAFHYAYTTKRPTALIYICRDDLRMYEFQIAPDDAELSKRYFGKVERITRHHEANIEPEREPFITYEDGKFSKNLGVEYSPFLFDIYGFTEPKEYSEKFKGMVGKWNRVMSRMLKSQKMTPKNEEIIKEIIAFGFDFELIKTNIAELVAKGVVPEDDEEAE